MPQSAGNWIRNLSEVPPQTGCAHRPDSKAIESAYEWSQRHLNLTFSLGTGNALVLKDSDDDAAVFGLTLCRFVGVDLG